MKILIIGAGAMGCLFAAFLSRTHDVILTDEDSPALRAVGEDGVTVVEPGGREARYAIRVSALEAVGEIAELAVVLTKSMHTRAILEKCKSALGEETTLLSLQNGAGHEQQFREFVQDRQILLGATGQNANWLMPGCVFHGGEGLTTLGALPGCDPMQAVHTAAVLRACGFPAGVAQDVRVAIWEKLMLDVSAGAVAGVLEARYGLCADSYAARELTARLVREAVEAANADGIALDREKTLNRIQEQVSSAKGGVSSMCADLEAGRQTEVETITGAVLRAARKHGVPAPTHEAVALLIHAMEDRSRLRDGVRDK